MAALAILAQSVQAEKPVAAVAVDRAEWSIWQPRSLRSMLALSLVQAAAMAAVLAASIQPILVELAVWAASECRLQPVTAPWTWQPPLIPPCRAAAVPPTTSLAKCLSPTIPIRAQFTARAQ